MRKKEIVGLIYGLPTLCAVALFSAMSVESHGAPVFGEVFDLSQPDGSPIEVRIWGDEYYGVTETLDGYTLVRDPQTMFFCYAELSEDGNDLVSTGVSPGQAKPRDLGLEPHIRIHSDAAHAKAMAARARFDQHMMSVTRGNRVAPGPTTGNVLGITLIIEFPDEPGTILPAEVEDYCNQAGYTGFGNNGSINDYFFEVSDGLLNYTNFVPLAYYTAANNKAYYTDPTQPYGDRARELITEALAALDASGFDFSAYDADSDTFIDALNCFYAGSVDNAWAEGLWPHASGINWCADGVCTSRYQITNMGSSLRLSTFCHENGHMLMGWPDLYDYDGDSAGIGQFGLMCNAASGTNPVQPSADMKYRAGWTNTTLLTGCDPEISIPSALTNTFYKYDNPANPDEYFIIENRQQTDRDTFIPDSGLAIWHVDRAGNNSWQQQTTAMHYQVTLVQADGDWDMENNNNQGDFTDLYAAPTYTACTPKTNPNTNWWDFSDSGLCIRAVSASADTMTFSFCNDWGNSAPPTIACSATGGKVDDDCEAVVTFQGTVTDDACLSANDVIVNVTLSTANATLIYNPNTDLTITQVNDTTVTVSGSARVTGLTGCPATVRVTIDAVDCCGEEATQCVTTADVRDNTDPTITGSATGGKVDDDCEYLMPFTATIDDNCCVDPGDVTVDVSLLTGNATLGVPNINKAQAGVNRVIVTGTVLVYDLTSCPATVQITVNADDCCGNSAISFVTTADVWDNIDPVITCPAPITLERGDKICLRCVGGVADGNACDEAGDCPGGICVNPVEHWLDSTTATDNCDTDVDIVDDSAANGFDCGFPYGTTTTVTWTATDDCDNSVQCSSEITIEPADRVDVTQKGSLLFYSKVEIKWDESGNVTQDTFLDLTNDYPEDVFVQLYFVNGDAPLDEVFAGDPPQLVERGHPGWNWVDCQIMLTGNEPTYFSALTGLPTGCQPFTVLDPGSPPGRPDLDGAAGHRVLRGYALAWAVNQFGREIQWNHLKGDAVIVNYADAAAWEYNAYSFSTRCVEQGEEPPDCTLFDGNGVCCEAEVIPGRLDMDAFQYDFNFSKLLLDFYASGSQAFSNGGVIASVATDLTLYPASADLRQDTEGPVVTKAKFDIWNMNEIRFSGTTRCIACWDQTLLSRYGAPNHFMLGNLHTDKGKARINGVASTVVCGPLSENAAMLGVAKKVIGFSGVGTGVAHAGMTLVGMGEEAATVLYDVIEPPAPLRDGLDAETGSVDEVDSSQLPK